MGSGTSGGIRFQSIRGQNPYDMSGFMSSPSQGFVSPLIYPQGEEEAALPAEEEGITPMSTSASTSISTQVQPKKKGLSSTFKTRRQSKAQAKKGKL